MVEVTLGSLVKVSPSTTRMCPSSSRTHDTDLTNNIQYSTVTCLDVKLGRLTAKMRDGQQTVTLTALPFTDDAIYKVHFTPFWLVSCLKIEIVVYVG